MITKFVDNFCNIFVYYVNRLLVLCILFTSRSKTFNCGVLRVSCGCYTMEMICGINTVVMLNRTDV